LIYYSIVYFIFNKRFTIITNWRMSDNIFLKNIEQLNLNWFSIIIILYIGLLMSDDRCFFFQIIRVIHFRRYNFWSENKIIYLINNFKLCHSSTISNEHNVSHGKLELMVKRCLNWHSFYNVGYCIWFPFLYTVDCCTQRIKFMVVTLNEFYGQNGFKIFQTIRV